jgi:alcohol dehydrogenase (cytochrome c)
MSLDAQHGVLYIPVGNPAPDFYDDDRPGSNLYTNSVVALDVRTGKLQWYRQVTPHDTHDWDLTQVSPIFSATVNGKLRNLISVAGKEGILHLMDRDTREVLYEVPFTSRTNPDAVPSAEGVHFCPGPLGGEEWNGPAYNPKTATLFVPANDWCATVKKAGQRPEPGKGLFMGGDFAMDPANKGGGWLTAVEATNGQIKWRYRSPKSMLAGVSVTSGGLVFTGEVDGNFLALDAADGKVLYKFKLGGPAAGGVITYALGAEQYVAVVSGRVSNFFAAMSGDNSGGTPTIVLFGLH